MKNPSRIEGYAIVSEDGMLANAAGVMPASLKLRPIRLSSNEGSMVSTSSCTGGIPTNSSEIRICDDD